MGTRPSLRVGFPLQRGRRYGACHSASALLGCWHGSLSSLSAFGLGRQVCLLLPEPIPPFWVKSSLVLIVAPCVVTVLPRSGALGCRGDIEDRAPPLACDSLQELFLCPSLFEKGKLPGESLLQMEEYDLFGTFFLRRLEVPGMNPLPGTVACLIFLVTWLLKCLFYGTLGSKVKINQKALKITDRY